MYTVVVVVVVVVLPWIVNKAVHVDPFGFSDYLVA
jgi:hypothetical protein